MRAKQHSTIKGIRIKRKKCYLEPLFLLLESLFLFDSNNNPCEETKILLLNTLNGVIKVLFILLKDGKFDVLVRYW